jgi:hydroxypyruvate isomerase
VRGFSANVSTLYGGLPFEERFEAAAADGFECVEFWVAEDPPRVIEAIRALALSVSQINVDPGPGPGDAGLLSNPTATRWWRAKFAATLEIAAALDCPTINVLAGGSAAEDPGLEHRTMLDNLDWALHRLDGAAVTLVLEPLNRIERPDYLLHTIDDVVDARAALGDPERLKLLFDVYHVHQEHDDLPTVFAEHASIVGHVQLADFPGRCEPGTGEIDVAAFLEILACSAYAGWIGLEYYATGATSALAWLHTVPVPETLHTGSRVQLGLPGPQYREV